MMDENEGADRHGFQASEPGHTLAQTIDAVILINLAKAASSRATGQADDAVTHCDAVARAIRSVSADPASEARLARLAETKLAALWALKPHATTARFFRDDRSAPGCAFVDFQLFFACARLPLHRLGADEWGFDAAAVTAAGSPSGAGIFLYPVDPANGCPSVAGLAASQGVVRMTGHRPLRPGRKPRRC